MPVERCSDGALFATDAGFRRDGWYCIDACRRGAGASCRCLDDKQPSRGEGIAFQGAASRIAPKTDDRVTMRSPDQTFERKSELRRRLVRAAIRADGRHRLLIPSSRVRAFSSEVDTPGSRKENASRQKARAAAPIQSERRL